MKDKKIEGWGTKRNRSIEYRWWWCGQYRTTLISCDLDVREFNDGEFELKMLW